MSESNTISLLVPQKPSPRSHDLPAHIQKIVAQKGHFRHVTEQSLRAEIQGKTPATSSQAQDSLTSEAGPPDDEELPQKRQERLWKRREEMIERLK